MSETRKIAAILVSDVVGYSRLAGADEDRILARLRALRSDLIDPTSPCIMAASSSAPATAASSSSAASSTRCAARSKCRRDGRTQCRGAAPDRRIDFRIGIHLGDVVEESDGDLMGDGVNIAARLEGDRRARRDLSFRGRLSAGEGPARSGGHRSRPNATQEHRRADPGLFAASRRPRAGKARERRPSRAEPKKRSSLAPLVAGIVALILIGGATWWFLKREPAHGCRFEGAGRGRASLHRRAAVHQSLQRSCPRLFRRRRHRKPHHRSLAHPRQLRHRAQHRLHLQGQEHRRQGDRQGTRRALRARRLGAARSKPRARQRPARSTPRSGAHLWADRFEEDASDLFKLQDQVVARLANSLGYELVRAEGEKGGRSQNPDAIDLDMRGQALLQHVPMTRDNNDAARALFERALAIDPNNAAALAGDAYTYMLDFDYGWTNPQTDYDAKIIGQADRALALAPDTTGGVRCEGAYLMHFRTARRRRSTSPTPVSPSIQILPASMRARAIAETGLGRFEQAKSDLRQAMRLSPRDPRMGLWHFAIGGVEIEQGHYDAAIDEFHKAIEAGYRPFIPYADARRRLRARRQDGRG